MFNVFLSEEKAKTTLPSSPRKKYKRLIYLLYFIFSTKLQLKVHTLTPVGTIPAGQSWQRWPKRLSPKITACEHARVCQ